MLLLRICGALLLLPVLAGAQARLVLNGAKINIANGAQLVVDNPAPNALIRYDGYIISEGETNNLKWNIGTKTGTYTVPLGYGSNTYLPLQFTKDAGAGYGSFLFATYHTSWQNSDWLPGGVTNVSWNGWNNSTFIADRFWKINASNYTIKPSLSNLSFAYANAEIASPNTITESTLEARCWNSTAKTWADFTPAAQVNTTANTVTLASVPAAQLQDWWLLTDNVHVLPIDGLQFTAAAAGHAARLNWATATETAGLLFTLERSANGVHFTAIANIYDNATRMYTFLDADALWGKSYYRIKQTDAAGKVRYSLVRSVFIQAGSAVATIYPNPVTGHRFTVDLHRMALKNIQLTLYNASGALVFMQAVSDGQASVMVSLPKSFAPGLYTLQLASAQGNLVSQKLLVK